MNERPRQLLGKPERKPINIEDLSNVDKIFIESFNGMQTTQEMVDILRAKGLYFSEVSVKDELYLLRQRGLFIKQEKWGPSRQAQELQELIKKEKELREKELPKPSTPQKTTYTHYQGPLRPLASPYKPTPVVKPIERPRVEPPSKPAPQVRPVEQVKEELKKDKPVRIKDPRDLGKHREEFRKD